MTSIRRLVLGRLTITHMLQKTLMIIRPEHSRDIEKIRALITEAFDGAAHSDGTEGDIVDALRQGGALTVSLVAEHNGEIVGHVAFSPVQIDGEEHGWYGLGPVAVRPEEQRQGVGRRLIEAGLAEIKSLGAAGCVVLGDPGYYSRFGFKADPALCFPGVPQAYFQRLDLEPNDLQGIVVYHQAFYGA